MADTTLRLIDLTGLLSRALEDSDTQPILELRGLGKELWKRVDAPAHVEAERRSWD